MAKFRSINIHSLKEGVDSAEFENFILDELQDAYREFPGFIYLELKKKDGKALSIGFGESFIKIEKADYIISEFWDTKEKMAAIWYNGLSQKDFAKNFGLHVTEVIQKFFELSEKVGYIHCIS